MTAKKAPAKSSRPRRSPKRPADPHASYVDDRTAELIGQYTAAELGALARSHNLPDDGKTKDELARPIAVWEKAQGRAQFIADQGAPPP